MTPAMTINAMLGLSLSKLQNSGTKTDVCGHVASGTWAHSDTQSRGFEMKMSIGFAAFTRHQTRNVEIRIVVQDRNDTALMNKIKSVIDDMCFFHPRLG